MSHAMNFEKLPTLQHTSAMSDKADVTYDAMVSRNMRMY